MVKLPSLFELSLELQNSFDFSQKLDFGRAVVFDFLHCIASGCFLRSGQLKEQAQNEIYVNVVDLEKLLINICV